MDTITYSRNVFLPLTHVCRNHCGYCIFREPVHEGCVMEKSAVIDTLKLGVASGCTEALFTFGERPEEEKGFAEHIRKVGYETVLDYCYDMCKTALEMGILPHTNAGILDCDELKRFREVNPSMGLMLETTADIPAHRNCAGKKPEVRIEMLENAGKLRIPFTTGLLLGIGETPADREESLEVIRDVHRRYDHIQEVIIQNFCPKPSTPMEKWAVPGPEEVRDLILLAREILPADISIQIPPNLINASELIDCGVTDLGGVSPVTIDYVNPEHPWPEIEELSAIVGKDRRLCERLCIYRKYIDKGWYDPKLAGLIDKLSRDISERNAGL